MQSEYGYGGRASARPRSRSGPRISGAELVLDTFMLRREGGVLFADIAEPPMNLLSPELVRDLVSLVLAADADESAKVIVFGSATPHYFLGDVDVTRIPAYQEATAQLGAGTSHGALFHRLSASRLVSIAQIEGRTSGAGNEFALACDLRFAAMETAVFAQPEAALGLIPGAGGLRHLAGIAGRARALETIIGGGDYDAAQAERYGWVNRATPASALPDFVRRLAQRIASFPTAGVAEVKTRANAIGLADTDEPAKDGSPFLRTTSQSMLANKIPGYLSP